MSQARTVMVLRVFFALCSLSLFTLWLSSLFTLPTWLMTVNKGIAIPLLYPILAVKLAWWAYVMASGEA